MISSCRRAYCNSKGIATCALRQIEAVCIKIEYWNVVIAGVKLRPKTVQFLQREYQHSPLNNVGLKSNGIVYVELKDYYF